MTLADELREADLEEVARWVQGCTRCPLHVARTQAVPGEGPSDARIFLLGEAPGRAEDEAGRPFVGRGGRLLDEALEEAGLARDEVFVTNAVKCRPPDNRRPRKEELLTCQPYHLRQMALVGPRVLVTLGGVALRSLIPAKGPLRDLRGRELSFRGIPVVATYHPAGVLRQRKTLRSRLVEDLSRARSIARST